MPMDTEALSKLLGSLYDAAADPCHWNQFLRDLGRATGAQSAGLVLHDEGQNVHTISHSWEIDPEFLSLYQEYYDSVDIWAQRGLSILAGAVFPSESLCPLAELTKTEVYNDFMVPFGIEHGLFAVVENSGSRLTSVSLFRARALPEFQTRELQILRFLAPHLERAFKLHFQLSQLKALSEGVETALDMLPIGVIFLGPMAKSCS